MESENKKKKLQALLDAVQESQNPPPVGDETVQEDSANRSGLDVGQTLGDFRLIRELGRGGMGVVYEAEQISLRRRVALKVLYPGLSSSVRTLHRFHREAEAVSQISHPSIISVYAVGSVGSTHFFAMRYLPGPNLAQLVDQLQEAQDSGKSTVLIDLGDEPMEAPGDDNDFSSVGIPAASRFPVRNYVFQAIEVIARVAEGLNVAHKEGLIHRDVKPGNLVFDRSGQLVLTDFGIAKASHQTTITRTGEFIGSPGYISPEQAMARRVEVDHRTDIYSLGVTLYEFLTLKQPFLEDTLEATLRAILTRTPLSPRKLNPRLPKDIETVVLKAIEKDPDKRFNSAGEMAAELRRILNFEAIQSSPIGPITQAARLVRRHRAVAVAILSSLALVIGGFWMWSLMENKREAQKKREEVASSVIPEDLGVTELLHFVSSEEGILDEEILAKIEDARGSLNVENPSFSKTVQKIRAADTRIKLVKNETGAAADRFLPKLASVKIQMVKALENRILHGDLQPAGAAELRRYLKEYLNDADTLVVKNTAVTLGRIGGGMAVAALTDTVYHWNERILSGDKDLRPDFVEAIGFVDHPSVFDALEELSRHEEVKVRLEVVRALRNSSHPSKSKLLERLAENDSDPAVSTLAHEVMKEQP
ncbi:MAG: protein kinase [Planctomycetota bacterium]|nr:protein kinase [Planctomycetota bacterium]